MIRIIFYAASLLSPQPRTTLRIWQTWQIIFSHPHARSSADVVFTNSGESRVLKHCGGITPVTPPRFSRRPAIGIGSITPKSQVVRRGSEGGTSKSRTSKRYAQISNPCPFEPNRPLFKLLEEVPNSSFKLRCPCSPHLLLRSGPVSSNINQSYSQRLPHRAV